MSNNNDSNDSNKKSIINDFLDLTNNRWKIYLLLFLIAIAVYIITSPSATKQVRFADKLVTNI